MRKGTSIVLAHLEPLRCVLFYTVYSYTGAGRRLQEEVGMGKLVHCNIIWDMVVTAEQLKVALDFPYRLRSLRSFMTCSVRLSLLTSLQTGWLLLLSKGGLFARTVDIGIRCTVTAKEWCS